MTRKPKATTDWRALALIVERMADHTAVCSHCNIGLARARNSKRREMVMVERDDFLRALAIAKRLLADDAGVTP